LSAAPIPPRVGAAFFIDGGSYLIGLADPSLPAIIAAIGGAIAAILGGTATIIAARTRRESRVTARIVESTNQAVNGHVAKGRRSIGDQVDDLTDVSEIPDAVLPLLRKIADRLDVPTNGGRMK
jgi:hypothetical protein